MISSDLESLIDNVNGHSLTKRPVSLVVQFGCDDTELLEDLQRTLHQLSWITFQSFGLNYMTTRDSHSLSVTVPLLDEVIQEFQSSNDFKFPYIFTKPIM